MSTNLNNREIWVPPGGRGMYREKYKGKMIVVTSKTYIWISPEVHQILGRPQFMCVFSQGRDIWGLSACSEDSPGAYSVESKQVGQIVMRAPTFLKTKNIPIGFVFVGKFENSAIVFNIVPDEKTNY